MNLNKKILTILILLVIIRMAMSIALIYGFPEKGSYPGGYFYLGDEDEYFKLAFSLARFKPIDSYRTLGFPVLLLPFIWLTKVNNAQQLFLPVAIFHGCFLAPLSIILVALIAKKLTQDRRVALFSATIWTFFPYLVYIFVHTNASFCQDVPAMRMAHQMWLQALSDPPSAFLVLVAIYVFIISLDKKNIIYPFLTGASFGLATLVRPGNAGLAILFLLFYIYKKKLKNLFLFISSSFFVALPQFIYNWYFYGFPFKFTTLFTINNFYALEHSQLIGYPVEVFSIRNFSFSVQQIILKFPFFLLLIIFVIFLVMVYTLFRLYRESRRGAVILVLWILPYLIIYGSKLDFHNAILHYLMPIIPAILIVTSLCIFRISR